MTIDPTIETRHSDAIKTYHLAAHDLAVATTEWAFAQAVDAFPGTVTLYVNGEIGDEGQVLVRCRMVADIDGRALAGYDEDDMSTSEAWDDFTDLVDPQLDWLGETQHDDWLGPNEITAPPAAKEAS